MLSALQAGGRRRGTALGAMLCAAHSALSSGDQLDLAVKPARFRALVAELVGVSSPTLASALKDALSLLGAREGAELAPVHTPQGPEHP